MPLVVVAVLLAAGLSFVVARSLSQDHAQDQVRLVAADETGEHPFTVSVSTVTAADVELVTSGRARLTADPVTAEPPSTPQPRPADPALTVRRAAVDGEVLYATSGTGVCDTQALAEALAADAEARAGWLDLMEIEEAELDATLDTFTALVLTRDTAVTNSLYRNGSPEQFQAILQAGTAVLVDAEGVPRVQCSCGNPLGPPEDQSGRELAGDRWERFDPAAVVQIDAADSDADVAVQIVDLDTNTLRSMPLGGTVTLDGYLVDDAEGVHVVSEDGARTTVLHEPVAVVADDGMGGLLFQYPRTGDGSVYDGATAVTLTHPLDEREAAIWHLPAGAVDPRPLLPAGTPSREWFGLQTAGLLAGRPAAVYARVTFDPGATEDSQTQGTMILRFLDSGEERQLGPTVSLYEGFFGPVSMAGDRLSVDVGYDYPAFDLYDASGAALPSGCAYPLDGETECEYNSVLATPTEFVALHIDDSSFYFSVVRVSAETGAFLGGSGTEVVGDAAVDNPPSDIDAHDGRAVISWPTDARSGQPLPTLLIDLATDEGRLLDIVGRTRILRAPIVRPSSPEEAAPVSSTTAAPATTAAEPETGPTWDQIKGATIPSLCEQPPTTLVNGVHTEVPEGMGKFELLERLEDGSPGIVTGLASPDAGPLTAVVASCNLGGVGWPNPVVLFSGDGDFYAFSMLGDTDAEYALWNAQGFEYPAREGVTGIEVRNGSLVVHLRALLLGECDACLAGPALVHAHAENRSLVVDRVEAG